MKKKQLLLSCFILFLAFELGAQNWPSFRGPGASGIGDGHELPSKWDVDKSDNVLWKTPIPGLAHSSPIVWDDNVFVTTAIASDRSHALEIGQVSAFNQADDMSRQSWRIFCIDRSTGKILWERTAQEDVPRVQRHPKTTHASATPATDGKYVVALFASGGLYCYDFDGDLKWSQDLGVLNANWSAHPDISWGPASSPIIFENLVIVQGDIDKDPFIAAFSLETGRQAWRTPRATIASWSTPTVYEGKKQAELIINGSEDIRGYNPRTGRELWNLRPTSSITVPTPFAANGLIYACSGYRQETQPIYAIVPGSTGDITLKEGATKSGHIAWSTQRGAPYIPTPIVYENYLYVCGYNGVLSCYEAKTGELLYERRLGPGGYFSASPVAGDGKIFAASEDGEVYVVKAGPKFELLATNPMGEVCMASPAIAQGMIIIRTQFNLFAIGID